VIIRRVGCLPTGWVVARTPNTRLVIPPGNAIERMGGRKGKSNLYYG